MSKLILRTKQISIWKANKTFVVNCKNDENDLFALECTSLKPFENLLTMKRPQIVGNNKEFAFIDFTTLIFVWVIAGGVNIFSIEIADDWEDLIKAFQEI